MAASSTFGPPKSPDGMKVDRIKPDVVAPGINILSTCSGAREKVKDGDAAGLEKRAKGKYVDERYYYSNGTSMATPLVAGCVAVLRQALVEMSGVKEPSAALLKALIVNGAVPLEKNKGVFDPQFKWGFGRVNLAASIAHLDDPTKKKMVGFQTRMIKVLEGTPYLFTELTVPPAPFSDDALADAKNSVSKRRLRVTLAWTDFPSPLLQHRLYLSVQSEGKSGKLIRLGNRKGELTDKPDEANNVQKVDLVDIPPGPARILVHYEASETWVGKQEVDADVAWFIE
jgi:serine protease AprX